MFFAAHVDKTIPQATKGRGDSAATESAPTIRGWLCRNGTLSVKDGALVLTPDSNAKINQRPFVTNSQLDLPGPVTAILKVRGINSSDGSASITWRTKAESFAPHQSATFDWPANDEWHEVHVTLPEKLRIVHLRILPPTDATRIEIQSIQLQGKGHSYVVDFARSP